jgi:hypothetical protein
MSPIAGGLLLFISLACNAQDCQELIKGQLIQKIVDKQTKSIRIAGIPTIDFMETDATDISLIIIEKNVRMDSATYTISITKGAINIPDETNLRGVSLLFDDGTAIEKRDQRVKVSAGSRVVLTVDFVLTIDDFTMLARKKLKGVVLIKSPAEVPPKMATQINTMANCIISM